MKLFNLYHLLPALLFLLVTSCGEKSNLDPEGQWELSQASNISPASNTTVQQLIPGGKTSFSWDAASSTAGYNVYYSVVIDTLGTTEGGFETPILELVSGNGGRDLSLEMSDDDIDEALSLAGYPANSEIDVTWAVKASCLSKATYEAANVVFKRFPTEIIPSQLFITGSATENGDVLENAIALQRLNNASGVPSNKFEIYTKLVAGKTYQFYSAQSLPAHRYGGADGQLVKSGSAIASPENTGVYRINVDLDNNTYSLFEITQFGAIGSPFKNGWNSDEALDYMGHGVWQKSIEMVGKGNFIFRANGDWVNIIKRIQGTTNKVVCESDAASQGVQYEDIPSDKIGTFIVTLDLSAGAYTYSLVRDPNAAQPITTPAQLFLLANGQVVNEFVLKDADIFESNGYVALQANTTYSFNSKADGTGTAYAIAANIGATETLGGDLVSDKTDLTEGDGDVLAQYDQAFKLTVDFAGGKLYWSYYNMKLFHWSNWDTRDELVMTYVHPYSFTLTANLVGGYELKFNSPWAVEFGAGTGADPNALSGTATNKALADDGVANNFTCIKSDGSYKVSISNITPDYKTCQYKFEKQ